MKAQALLHLLLPPPPPPLLLVSLQLERQAQGRQGWRAGETGCSAIFRSAFRTKGQYQLEERRVRDEEEEEEAEVGGGTEATAGPASGAS